MSYPYSFAPVTCSSTPVSGIIITTPSATNITPIITTSSSNPGGGGGGGVSGGGVSTAPVGPVTVSVGAGAVPVATVTTIPHAHSGAGGNPSAIAMSLTNSDNPPQPPPAHGGALSNLTSVGLTKVRSLINIPLASNSIVSTPPIQTNQVVITTEKGGIAPSVTGAMPFPSLRGHGSAVSGITSLSVVPLTITSAGGGVGTATTAGALNTGSTGNNNNNNGGPLAAAASAAGCPRLKVEDALTYLDKVKLQFCNKPQVYNDFLDIMKEFKSQTIDTPGVIQRVSTLFAGHPDLIVGFNTFLPPGYKIEMHNESVSVSTPSSTVIISSGPLVPNTSVPINFSSSLQPCKIKLEPGSRANSGTPIHPTPRVPTHITLSSGTNLKGVPTMNNLDMDNKNVLLSGPISMVNLGDGPIKNTLSSNHNTVNIAQPIPTNGNTLVLPAASMSTQSTGTNSAITVSATTLGGPSVDKTQTLEFNHAITYVNKIKSRFAHKPENYKAFLDILHTFQKEQKAFKEGKIVECKLSEQDVMAKVAILFEHQKDLLEEFVHFLPEAGGGGGGASMVSSLPKVSSGSSITISGVPPLGLASSLASLGGGLLTQDTHLLHVTHSNMGPSSSSSSTMGGKEPIYITAQALMKDGPGSTVKKPIAGRGTANMSVSGPSIHIPGPSSTNCITMKRIAPSSSGPVNNKRVKMTSQKDVTHQQAAQHVSLQEYAFFDRVRSKIDPKSYDAFLHALFLYNHEILNRAECLALCQPLFGKNSELNQWMANFTSNKRDGDDDLAMLTISGLPSSGAATAGKKKGSAAAMAAAAAAVSSSIPPIMDTPKIDVDYSSCKRVGPSYRMLPKNFPLARCTGRNEFCQSVLNDYYVSFPSWSEDSSFVTSKKTQFEEYISKAEDERFELDVVMDSNRHTIRIFETLEQKLSKMSHVEQMAYRLDSFLGGTSETIQLKAIRRIYNERTSEIVEYLQSAPYLAVPIVLKRLKHKDEEWKEAQKNFNRVWRDQLERYYLKSLDHMGISFKQNDTKMLRSKSLLTEIETMFDDRINNRNSGIGTITCGPHITFEYKDKYMLDEACSLIIHHVKRSNNNVEDKQRIKQLMRHFIPDLFSTRRGDLSDDETEELMMPPPVRKAKGKGHDGHTPAKGKGKKGRTVDPTGSNSLQVNKALAAAAAAVSGTNGRTSPTAIASTSIAGGSSTSAPGTSTSSPTPRTPMVPSPSVDMMDSDVYTLFFGTSHWYLFLRLHALLCDRLHKMHQASLKLIENERRERACSQGNDAPSIKLRLTAPKSDTIEAEKYFPMFIDMVKQVLDGGMDSNTFEDSLREMFGINAYIGFTMDKVVTNIVRQLNSIISDEQTVQSTESFLSELESTNGLATGGPVDTQACRSTFELAYQKKVEGIIGGDEHTFKFMFYRDDGRMTIELLDTDNESEYGMDVDRWREFADRYFRTSKFSYLDEDVVERLCKRPVFLPKNIPNWKERSDQYIQQLEGPNKGLRDKYASGDEHKIDVNSDYDDDPEKMEIDEDQPPPAADASNAVTINDLGESVSQSEGAPCFLSSDTFRNVSFINIDNPKSLSFYRKGCFTKARSTHEKVSKRMFDRFDKFHCKWLENADPRNICRIDDWLRGAPEQTESGHEKRKDSSSQVSTHVRPITHKIEVISNKHLTTSPYRAYNKFKVTRPPSSTTSSS